ncbi:hypothetical protein L484_025881 [Morus notabilis]|uniref:Mediator of RNA polymerase II transcription subunit 18 n=1 Tax=Morus notabilis TaxID=981085 RepID=W9RD66_9ROSA|nr:uncharacterized protein LOC21408563 [Morus notabilis]EXB65615.1 hypothetical protein L484_025881 [Morus notabilis]
MIYSTTSVNTFSFHLSKTGLLPLDWRSRRSSSRVVATRILASRRDHQANHHHNHHHNHYMSSSRLVDENMIVLRKRIHEMKMVERNYEPPSDWMDWEKKYYTSYDSLICQMMGFLQSQMMNTRPSLALGMVVLVILSLPTSSVMVLFHLMGLAKELLIN